MGLSQQVDAAHGLIDRTKTQARQQLADLFGEVNEERDDLVGRAFELGAQVGALRRDAGWARVQMTLARHVAADRDQAGCAESEFLRAEQRCNDDVARATQAAVSPQADASA